MFNHTTLEFAYSYLTAELDALRQEQAVLAKALQNLPAAGAVTLALFVGLTPVPAQSEGLARGLIVIGLLPFTILVVLSVREFGLRRASPAQTELSLTDTTDALPPNDWLALKVGERRLEIAALRGAISRKRNRLGWASASLALQVGYLVLVSFILSPAAPEK